MTYTEVCKETSPQLEIILAKFMQGVIREKKTLLDASKVGVKVNAKNITILQ
jgi:hypothetical protein